MRVFCTVAILLLLSVVFIAAPAPSQPPPNVTFILRDGAGNAWKRAQAGDAAGYKAGVASLEAYVRSVYKPNELDRGWRELASDQLAIGDRAGAKATAQKIRSPRLRAEAFGEIASKYRDRAAFADATQASLQCPAPTDLSETIRNVARDEAGKGMTAEATAALRSASQRTSKPSGNARDEEKRQYAMRLIATDQIHYRDYAGAKATARAIGDAEALALVGVAQFKSGDGKGAQGTFGEAISLADHATGDKKPYFLERITYALLDCGAVASARQVALAIPTGANLNNGHREKALRSVVFAQAGGGDIAGAKTTANAHLSRHWFTISSLRIAAIQRAKGNAQGALQTLNDARQHILAFPGGQGALDEDKVNCLNRIAFVQNLWGAADSRQTLTLSRGVAERQPDENLRWTGVKDVLAVQAMCGDTAGAMAAAQRLPGRYQGQAVAAVRKAGGDRQGYLSYLNSLCLDLKMAPPRM